MHATPTARDFSLSNFYPAGPSLAFFFKTSPEIFRCWLWLTPVPSPLLFPFLLFILLSSSCSFTSYSSASLFLYVVFLLLFSLKITNIVKSVLKGSEASMFVADFSLFISAKSLPRAESHATMCKQCTGVGLGQRIFFFHQQNSLYALL